MVIAFLNIVAYQKIYKEGRRENAKEKEKKNFL